MINRTLAINNRVSTIRQAWDRIASSTFFTIISLLMFSGLFYGLLIPWLHLYIDDWLWVWTWEKFGSAGLVKYFETNRPIWGLFFQISLPLLGQNILSHHLFALVIRWASSLACWWLLLLIWPHRRDLAFFGAILFLVFPGFVLQSIALTYGHIFLIYTIFLLSLCFQIYSMQGTTKRWPYQLLAMALVLINLLSMEYFFTLELARLFLLWIISKEKTISDRVKKTACRWAPYFVIWVGVLVWRAFFFKFQTHNYKFSLLQNLQTQPWETTTKLSVTVLGDLWDTSIGAWLPAIQRFSSMTWTQTNSLVTLLLMVIVFILVVIIGFAYRKSHQVVRQKEALQTVVLGVTVMLISGIPFWVTGLDVSPILLHSRLTISFMLGAIILFLGLLTFLPHFSMRLGLVAIAVAIAAGSQFQNANDFRLDWAINRKLMWQLYWRIPGLEEGTTLLLSDLRMNFTNVEELANTAALSTQVNSIYAVEKQIPDLSYYLLFARELDRSVPGGLQRGISLLENNVTSRFYGNTSKVLAAEFSTSRCFRLLDPSLDSSDETLPSALQKAAALSSWDWIHPVSTPKKPKESLFGPEPAHDWCYYFEKIELARQLGEWQTAAQLADEASSLGFSTNDSMEKIGLIEVYAHTGQWSRALELGQGFDPDKRPVLCRLWERIDKATEPSSEKKAAFQTIAQTDFCSNITQD